MDLLGLWTKNAQIKDIVSSHTFSLNKNANFKSITAYWDSDWSRSMTEVCDVTARFSVFLRDNFQNFMRLRACSTDSSTVNKTPPELISVQLAYLSVQMNAFIHTGKEPSFWQVHMSNRLPFEVKWGVTSRGVNCIRSVGSDLQLFYWPCYGSINIIHTDLAWGQ